MKLSRALFICSLASLAGASNSFAATVYVTNANVGWSITRTASSQVASTGDYRSFNYDGTPSTSAAVVETSFSSLWSAKNDPRLSTAQWIGMHSGDGGTTSDPFATRYVYTGSFTITEKKQLNVTFAGDNIPDRVILSSQPNGGGTVFGDYLNNIMPVGDQDFGDGRIYGFTQKNVQSMYAVADTGTVYITATLYNYSGPPTATHFSNGSAYGFILAVDATPAPMPAAAFTGLASLGVLALGYSLNRRRAMSRA